MSCTEGRRRCAFLFNVPALPNLPLQTACVPKNEDTYRNKPITAQSASPSPLARWSSVLRREGLYSSLLKTMRN
jgi:hypothetical protein